MQEVQKRAKHRAFKTQYYREWRREVERLDSDALTEDTHEGNSFPLSIILEQIKPWGRKWELRRKLLPVLGVPGGWDLDFY